MRKLRYILLAALLLGGQFALFVHAADLSAHVDGDTCEICLHSAPLDSGVVPVALVISATITLDTFLPETSNSVVTERIQAFAARGPPPHVSA